MWHKRDLASRPGWARYGVAVGCVVLGWAAREALVPAVGSATLPFIFFFPAAALAAWYGGFGPGALATFLGAAVANWFFIEPLHSLRVENWGQQVALGAFIVSSLFIVAAIEAMHRARVREVAALLKHEHAEAEMLAIVEHSGDAIFSMNLEGVIQTWNTSAERLFGYKKEEIVGHPITLLVPDERLNEERDVTNRLRQGLVVERFETDRIAKGGKRLRVAVSASPLKNGDGEVTGSSKIVQDIAELVAAREALVQEKELLATTLASIGDAVIVTNTEGRVTFLNGEAERLTKWTRAEASGRSLTEVFRIINEQTREPVENPVDKVFRVGAVVGLSNHTVLLAKDGTELPIDDSAAPIRAPDGPLSGVVLVFRDFTERKQAEDALRFSERRATAFLENSAIVAWLKDEQGQNIFLSDNYVRRFGLRDWKNKTDSELWPQDVAEGYRKNDLAVLALDRPLECVEEARTPEGEVSYWLNSKFWFKDETGRKYVGGVGVDITARTKAEQSLQESRHRLAMSLDASGGAAWGWDAVANRVDEWDGQYRELYGFRPDEPMTFETWLARIHPDDRGPLMERLKRLQEPSGDDIWDEEFRVLHPERGQRWICGLGRCYRDESGKLLRMTGVNLDVTDKREAQEVLKRGKQELEKLVSERTARLQELIGELEHVSYTITHDMRAPLRAMRAFAEALKEASEQHLGQEGRMFVGRIITGAERMDALITDALNYTKTVRAELPLGPVDVGRLLRGMLDTYPQFQGNEAEITVDPNLPLVIGNEAGLTQCFSNLLDNAVKFVTPGAKSKVRVWAETRDGCVRLWVEDNGIGISKEMLPRVFDMFSRGSSPQAGTGIGLALVRKVVDRMGGRVGAESEPGHGSRFWVELKSAFSMVTAGAQIQPTNHRSS